jgi:hypothetical protein
MVEVAGYASVTDRGGFVPSFMQIVKRSPPPPAPAPPKHGSASTPAAPTKPPSPARPPPPPPPAPPQQRVPPPTLLQAVPRNELVEQNDGTSWGCSSPATLSRRHSLGVPSAELQIASQISHGYNDALDDESRTFDTCEPSMSSPHHNMLFAPRESELTGASRLRPTAKSAQLQTAAAQRPGLENPAALRSLLRKVEPPKRIERVAQPALAEPAMFKLRPAAGRSTDASTPVSRPGFERPALRSTPGARASTYGGGSARPENSSSNGGATAHADGVWPAAGTSPSTFTRHGHVQPDRDSYPSYAAPLSQVTDEGVRSHTIAGGEVEREPETYIAHERLGTLGTGEQVLANSLVNETPSDTTRAIEPAPQEGSDGPVHVSQATLPVPFDMRALWHMGSLPAQPMAAWGSMVPPRISMLPPPGWPVGAGLGMMPGDAINSPSPGQYPYMAGPGMPMPSPGQYPYMTGTNMANLAASGMTPMIVMGPMGPMLVMAPEANMPSVEDNPAGAQPRVKWLPPQGTLAAQFDNELRSKLMSRAPVDT